MKLYSLAPLLVFGTVVVGLIIIATISTFFQRTTTFMEEKYNHRSSAQIDALYSNPLKNIKELEDLKARLTEVGLLLEEAINGGPEMADSIPALQEEILYLEQQIAEGDFYSDNILYAGSFVPPTPCIDNNEDDDKDGLTNQEEIILGTDCRSPDTDGDGVADGVDTNPLDFNIGGISTTFSFEPTPTPNIPPPLTRQLIVKEFYKNVANITTGELQWQNYIQANTGNLLKFLIHITVENTNLTETKSATLYDIFQTNEFIYTDNLQLFINNIEQPYSPLLDQTWYNGYNISVLPTETKTYELYFTATVKTVSFTRKIISNIAKLDLNYRTVIDQIFVSVL